MGDPWQNWTLGMESLRRRISGGVCANTAPFPLTPALSPWERGNRAPALAPIAAPCLSRGPNAWLPFPRGEGWSEGEQNALPLNGLVIAGAGGFPH